MNINFAWPHNRLLRALPSETLERLIPELETIECRREQILMDVESPIDAVYFPESGVISVVAVYADGSIVEMATIGREGSTGVQAFFGVTHSSIRFLVQIPGKVVKMSRATFDHAMKTMPPFRALMSSYAHALLEQVLVSGACNAAHSLSKRLARWLLMMRDRSDADVLPVTQNLLAEMLGVQRPTVTLAIQVLEQAGLILRGRKAVTIVNRAGLIDAACECYSLVRARLAFHLPKTYA